MIVKTILPRALERLATIEVGASVKKAVAQMAKPHTDLVVVSNQGEMAGVLTKTDIDAARRPIGIVYAREILQALLSEAENEDELLRDYISEVGYQ